MDAYLFTVSWTSGSINLQMDAYYLHCPELGGSVISHNGRRDICSKILFEQEVFGEKVSQNGQIHDPYLHALDVSHRELTALNVTLRDVTGQIVELNVGPSLSFTFSFLTKEPDE